MNTIIYYLLLIVIAVPLYVLSDYFKDNHNKVGRYICYFILLLIVLLFV
jgi:hypothetical protein